ncbi:Uncharacterized protein Adt_18924 [Abeliophyllum distichum]|uniref:Uncharacterized protein n=1 Tax=Abeliophyllum distichum TaxID=126358 RepID=A0ABD1TKX3_9LAMI
MEEARLHEGGPDAAYRVPSGRGIMAEARLHERGPDDATCRVPEEPLSICPVKQVMASEDSDSGDMLGAVVVMDSREVSPELVEVLSIQGIDTCTGEEIRIAKYNGMGLVGSGSVVSSSDFVGKWTDEDIPSIVNEAELDALRQAFRVPADIRFHVPEPHERACSPREGCVALHVQSFNVGMRLSLDPFYRCILRAYGLAPTQVAGARWMGVYICGFSTP